MSMRKIGSTMRISLLDDIVGKSCHVFEDALIELAEENGETLSDEDACCIVNDFLSGTAENGEKLFKMFHTCLKTVVCGELLELLTHDECYENIKEGMEKIFSNLFVTHAVLKLSALYSAMDVGLMWEIDYMNLCVQKAFYTDIAFPLISLTAIRWNEKNEIVPVHRIVTSEITDTLAIPAAKTARLGITYKILMT